MSFRDSPFNDIRVPMAWTAGLALVVALVVAIALMVSDRRESLQEKAYTAAKSTVDLAQAPVSGALAQPARWTESGVAGIKGYFFAVTQNRALRKENAELRQWKAAALALQDTNDRYKAVLGLKTDPPIEMITGRAVTDSRGPFANSRLINVGVERTVKGRHIEIGNPVMSEAGLVGRVTGVTRGASRVMMLTDVQSRTPVMIDRTNARAILTGDGGPNPRLIYLRGRDPVKVGDRVVTSGDGGVFPRGLPVGIAVKGLDGAWRVQLASDYAPIDFVRVLLFQDFSKLVDEKALSEAGMPPAPPGLNQVQNSMAKPVAAPPVAGAPVVGTAPLTPTPAPKAAAPTAPAGPKPVQTPVPAPKTAPAPAPKTAPTPSAKTTP